MYIESRKKGHFKANFFENSHPKKPRGEQGGIIPHKKRQEPTKNNNKKTSSNADKIVLKIKK